MILNCLSGYQTANIKSLPVKEGETLVKGDWVIFDTDGTIKKQTGDYAATQGVAFPIYMGAEAYDTKYLNKADVVTAKSGVLETDNVAATSISAGGALSIKDGKIHPLAEVNSGDAPVIGYALHPFTTGTLKFVLA